MLSVLDFPAEHTGVCMECTQEQCGPDAPIIHASNNAGPVTSRHQPALPSHQARQHQTSPWASQRATQSALSGPRQHRHAALPSSVTAYSDAGEYPSGRSTYGVSKQNRRKPSKSHAPRAPNVQRTVTLLAQEGAVDKELTEAEGLLQFLTSKEIMVLQQRRVNRVNPSQQSSNYGTTTQDEDVTLENSIPHYLTPNIRHCVLQICETWDVQHVAEIFPTKIWPKQGTLWNLSVLQLFLTLARQYPTARHCRGISRKFTELNEARRRKVHAKTQWTMGDATATCTWAKEEYGSPPPEGHGQEDTTRFSQRTRIPSKKAAALLDSLSKGNLQPQTAQVKDSFGNLQLRGGPSSKDKGKDYAVTISSSDDEDDSDE